MDLQSEDDPADVLGHRLAHAHGVAQDQVPLKLLQLVWLDALLRQYAESRVDAVIRPVLLESLVDDFTRSARLVGILRDGRD